jgi:hypothetical protein
MINLGFQLGDLTLQSRNLLLLRLHLAVSGKA